MINFIKDAVTAVSGIKTFLFNTDYRNNFDLQNVEFPCCVLTPIMRTNYDLKNIIRESAELQLSVVEAAPYDYSGDDLYAINKRCSDLALQVIANLQVKSKLDKELTFEFILPSGDELVSGVMCNLQCTMKQGSCIGAPSYFEVIVQPIKKESITRNGKHVIFADSGFTAMKEVEVDVNVDLKGLLQDKQVAITKNGTQTIVADEGFEGLSSVEVSSEVYEGFDFYALLGLENEKANQIFKKELNIALEYKKKKEITMGGVNRGDFNGFFLPSINLQNQKSMPLSYYGSKPILIGELLTPNVIGMNQCFSQMKNLIYVKLIDTQSCTNGFNLFAYSDNVEHIKLTSIAKMISTDGMFINCVYLKTLEFEQWKQSNISVPSSKLTPSSIRYIIWHALNGENILGFENEGATSRTFLLHATPYASWEEWKTTKPSVEDCGYLGVDETEITKYGELTWEDIALNIKLITIGA